MANILENNGNSERVLSFIFLAPKSLKMVIDGSHEIKRCLLLGRKVMTNLDSILKSRDITLPTKVCLVKERKKVKSLSRVQLFVTLWTPGSSVHGIF